MNRRVSPVSLWHGTSSVLLPSIVEKGLGGLNPLLEFGVIDFLNDALEYLEYDEVNFEDPEYIRKAEITKTARQCAHGMNFQHGHLYVTGDREKAETYAKGAPESIGMVRALIEISSRNFALEIQQTLERYAGLSNFLKANSIPVLVELPNIEIRDLFRENGGGIDEPVNSFLGKSAEQIEDSPIFSRLSFRLNRIIPFDDCIVHNIKGGLLGDAASVPEIMEERFS